LTKRLQTFSPFIFGALIAVIIFGSDLLSHAQSPGQGARGVIRLKVKYKAGDAPKDLPRKRFFLIKGSLEENKGLIEKMKQTDLLSRECYYRSKGASETLIKWLKDNDCESVYCREIEERYVTGSEAVPEFQAAYNQGLRDFKTPELARRWLVTNLALELRNGFYNRKQELINALVAQAESASKTKVMSVMTDRKGTAYLTDIEPGMYTISNLVGSETEKTSVLWACEKEVKAVDLATAMKRPFTLSNEKDAKVKCEIVERAQPVCNQAPK
jgi:hypothetical protein